MISDGHIICIFWLKTNSAFIWQIYVFFSPPKSPANWRFLRATVTQRETKHMHWASQLQNICNKATGRMFISCCMSDSSGSLAGSVFCQVCLQFQAEVLIYLSLQSAGEARLDEWEILLVALSEDMRISTLVALHSKQMLKVCILWELLPTLDGSVCLGVRTEETAASGSRIQPFSPTQMASQRVLHRRRAAKVSIHKKPQSLRKKSSQDMAEKRWFVLPQALKILYEV